MAEGNLKQMGENTLFYYIASRKSDVSMKYKKSESAFCLIKDYMRVNSQRKRTKGTSEQVVNFAICS